MSGFDEALARNGRGVCAVEECECRVDAGPVFVLHAFKPSGRHAVDLVICTRHPALVRRLADDLARRVHAN